MNNLKQIIKSFPPQKNIFGGLDAMYWSLVAFTKTVPSNGPRRSEVKFFNEKRHGTSDYKRGTMRG